MRVFRHAMTTLLAFAAVACDKSTQVHERSHPAHSDSAAQVIGAVDGEGIKLADAERVVALELYDLEMQRFRLLRGVTEAKLMAGLDAGGNRDRVAEIRLNPPMPPRLKIPSNPERARPEGAFPIEVVVFCNLESAHCVRSQEQLSRILPMFAGVTQYSDRDLILPFHRHARLAAEAGYCALEQGKYWQYRDLMFAGSGVPDRERIFRAIRASGLDITRFQGCLESGSSGAKLDSDARLARFFGVNAVPAVFVNGLYAGLNPEPAHLIWLIEKELNRLGVDSPRLINARLQSREPLQLIAMIHAADPGQGMAMLAPKASPGSAGFYREGDALGAELTLRRVTTGRIELLKQGVAEWLDFNNRLESTAPLSGSEQGAELDPKDQAVLNHPHRGVPVFLDRTEVLVRMTDINALEASLETVAMTAGGYHLLRIADIQPGSLYELLGLETGDVIVLVNEQPMHEGDTPLWNALQSDDEVRLRIMRRGGMAHHYTYRFQE